MSVVKANTVNRLGKCPSCKKSWQGNDILQHISTLSIYKEKSLIELERIATENYGWTKENPTRFSNAIVHSIEGVTLLECPHITCKHVFNAEDGTEYASMFDYRMGVTLESKKEVIEEEEEEVKPVEPAKIHVTRDNRFEVERQLEAKVKTKIDPKFFVDNDEPF